MNKQRRLIPDLDAEAIAQLDALAATRGVTSEALAGEVLRDYIGDDAALIRRCEIGRAQIARGEYVTHEQLVVNLRHWIATGERPS